MSSWKLGDAKKLSLIERGAKNENFKIFVIFCLNFIFQYRITILDSEQFQRAQNDFFSFSVRGVIISWNFGGSWNSAILEENRPKS